MKKIIYLIPVLLAISFNFASALAAQTDPGEGARPTVSPSPAPKTTPISPSGQATFPASNDPTNVKSGTPVKISLPNPLGAVKTIPQLIDRISDWLLGIATALLPLMIVWGAFKLLMSAGKPESIKEGREIITWAVLGYALLLISKGIILIIKEVLSKG